MTVLRKLQKDAELVLITIALNIDQGRQKINREGTESSLGVLELPAGCKPKEPRSRAISNPRTRRNMTDELADAQHTLIGRRAGLAHTEDIHQCVLAIGICSHNAVIDSKALGMLVNVGETSPKCVALTAVTFVGDDVGARSARGIEDLPVFFAGTVIDHNNAHC